MKRLGLLGLLTVTIIIATCSNAFAVIDKNECETVFNAFTRKPDYVYDSSAASGSFSGLELEGDTGTNEALTNNDVIVVEGGLGIDTVVTETDTIIVSVSSDVCMLDDLTKTGDVTDGSSNLVTSDTLYDNFALYVLASATSAWDKDASNDFDGAWGSLSGMPAGFSDGIDDTGAGGTGAATDNSYLVVALTDNLTLERSLTVSMPLEFTDAGADGAFNIQLNSDYTIPTSTEKGTYDTAYSLVNTSSDSWNTAYTLVNTSSDSWNSGYDGYVLVNASSDTWNTAYTLVNASSDSWNEAYTLVNASSDTWNTAYTLVNASSDSWNTAYGWGDHSAQDYVTSSDLSSTGTLETELEAVIDLQDLQGAVTDGQVPNDITLDNHLSKSTVFGGEVTGGYGSLVVGNDVLDDQYYDSEADLTTLLDDNYEVQLDNEAGLYAVLSDVTQFYEVGDKVGDADTLDTHDTSYFQVALSNEAGLYSALSDVTNFLQTGDALAGDDITDGSVDASELATGSVGDDEIDYANVTLADFDYQTAWRVFYSNTDGDVTELALGADGTYLMSNGASVAPTFETPAGGSSEFTDQGSYIEHTEDDVRIANDLTVEGDVLSDVMLIMPLDFDTSVSGSYLISDTFPFANGVITEWSVSSEEALAGDLTVSLYLDASEQTTTKATRASVGSSLEGARKTGLALTYTSGDKIRIKLQDYDDSSDLSTTGWVQIISQIKDYK